MSVVLQRRVAIVPTTLEAAKIFVSHVEIKQEADRVWLCSGCRAGRDDKNWETAETLVVTEKVRTVRGQDASSRQTRSGTLLLELEQVKEEDPLTEIRKMRGAIYDWDDKLVGYIEAPSSGPLRVRLNHPWDEVATAIMSTIQAGKPLETQDHKLRVISGTTDEELKIIRHAILVISQRKLRVVLNAS